MWLKGYVEGLRMSMVDLGDYPHKLGVIFIGRGLLGTVDMPLVQHDRLGEPHGPSVVWEK